MRNPRVCKAMVHTSDAQILETMLLDGILNHCSQTCADCGTENPTSCMCIICAHNTRVDS